VTSPAGGPTTPDEIRDDIAKHRAELAETVDALSDKLNVKAQAQKKVKPHQTQLVAGGGAALSLLLVLRIRKSRKNRKLRKLKKR
jgi:hypothetical protein